VFATKLVFGEYLDIQEARKSVFALKKKQFSINTSWLSIQFYSLFFFPLPSGIKIILCGEAASRGKHI